jgi:hypothetical protein
MNNLIYDNSFSHTSFINSQIQDYFRLKNNGVIFGQNIISGSRISGLGKDLEKLSNVKALNTTNSENSLMGLGLGLALNGTPSMFIMKQHDFALLGLDQLTNSVNLIQHFGFNESFIIVMVVVDTGFEGPQASLNNLDEFVSLSRQPVYFLNSIQNIENAFKCAKNPGLHMMALSQKQMKSQILNLPKSWMKSNAADDHFDLNSENLVIYTGFNTDFIEKLVLQAETMDTSFDFLLNYKLPFPHFDDIGLDHRKYARIAFIQDTKSLFTASHAEATRITSGTNRVKVFSRIANESWSSVFQDVPEYKTEEIINFLKVSI